MLIRTSWSDKTEYLELIDQAHLINTNILKDIVCPPLPYQTNPPPCSTTVQATLLNILITQSLVQSVGPKPGNWPHYYNEEENLPNIAGEQGSMCNIALH